MCIYRTRNNLSTGQKRGQAFCANELRADAVEILERRGIIHKVNTPPLELLEDFRDVYEELTGLGVITLGDLLCSNLLGYNCYIATGWSMLNQPQCKICKRRQ